MKKQTEPKLTDTQKAVFDFLSEERNQGSNVAIIDSCLPLLNELTIMKALKALTEKGLIIKSESKPYTYSLAKTDEKESVIIEKKNTKAVKVEKEIDEVKLPSLGRNTDKLKFNGELYPKGRLALAVFKKYLEDHPKTTIAELKKVFPDELSQRYGFFQTVEKAKKLCTDRPRYFLKPEELLKVGNHKIAVCSQWGSNNLPLKHFKSLGFIIK